MANALNNAFKRYVEDPRSMSNNEPPNFSALQNAIRTYVKASREKQLRNQINEAIRAGLNQAGIENAKRKINGYKIPVALKKELTTKLNSHGKTRALNNLMRSNFKTMNNSSFANFYQGFKATPGPNDPYKKPAYSTFKAQVNRSLAERKQLIKDKQTLNNADYRFLSAIGNENAKRLLGNMSKLTPENRKRMTMAKKVLTNNNRKFLEGLGQGNANAVNRLAKNAQNRKTQILSKGNLTNENMNWLKKTFGNQNNVRRRLIFELQKRTGAAPPLPPKPVNAARRKATLEKEILNSTNRAFLRSLGNNQNAVARLARNASSRVGPPSPNILPVPEGSPPAQGLAARAAARARGETQKSLPPAGFVKQLMADIMATNLSNNTTYKRFNNRTKLYDLPPMVQQQLNSKRQRNLFRLYGNRARPNINTMNKTKLEAHKRELGSIYNKISNKTRLANSHSKLIGVINTKLATLP
jgi:hypothetical protein